MFINFWYAAALAKDVTDDKPLKVRMLGQNFALFRDSDGRRPLRERHLHPPLRLTVRRQGEG